MKNVRFGIVAIAALLMWSCSQSNSRKSYEQSYEESLEEVMYMEDLSFDTKESIADKQILSPETYISSSAALENPSDTTRKMIRSANIKFKVKDVIKATYSIENIIVKNNGFVQNTELSSQINYTKETPVKEDSILITTYYSVINTLILRIPSFQLDTTLKEIAQFVEFMDYRIINVKDVTLDLLSKRLEQDRLSRYDSRMTNAIDSKGTRLNDVGNAENSILQKQAQADEAKIANLQILDKIAYSTITLHLYQNQSIKYEVIAKEKSIKPYSTPFGTRFIDALKFGWTVIVDFFLFLANIWSILLIAVLAVFGVRYLRKRSLKRKSE